MALFLSLVLLVCHIISLLFFMYSFCCSVVCVRVMIMQKRQCTVVAFSIVVVRENNKLSGLGEKQQRTGISIVHMFFTRFLLKATCKTRHRHQHYEKLAIVFLGFQKISKQPQNHRQHHTANDDCHRIKLHSVLIWQLVREQAIDMRKNIVMHLQHLIEKAGGVLPLK